MKWILDFSFKYLQCPVRIVLYFSLVYSPAGEDHSDADNKKKKKKKNIGWRPSPLYCSLDLVCCVVQTLQYIYLSIAGCADIKKIFFLYYSSSWISPKMSYFVCVVYYIRIYQPIRVAQEFDLHKIYTVKMMADSKNIDHYINLYIILFKYYNYYLNKTTFFFDLRSSSQLLL